MAFHVKTIRSTPSKHHIWRYLGMIGAALLVIHALLKHAEKKKQLKAIEEWNEDI